MERARFFRGNAQSQASGTLYPVHIRNAVFVRQREVDVFIYCGCGFSDKGAFDGDNIEAGRDLDAQARQPWADVLFPVIIPTTRVSQLKPLARQSVCRAHRHTEARCDIGSSNAATALPDEFEHFHHALDRPQSYGNSGWQALCRIWGRIRDGSRFRPLRGRTELSANRVLRTQSRSALRRTQVVTTRPGPGIRFSHRRPALSQTLSESERPTTTGPRDLRVKGRSAIAIIHAPRTRRQPLRRPAKSVCRHTAAWSASHPPACHAGPRMPAS
jgi:hypothetical protein